VYHLPYLQPFPLDIETPPLKTLKPPTPLDTEPLSSPALDTEIPPPLDTETPPL
jgi:hypothetical protein